VNHVFVFRSPLARITQNCQSVVILKSLQHLHTFGLPAHCADTVSIKTVQDAHDFIAQYHDTPYYLLGQGSNTAFVADYQGTVVEIALKGISVNESPQAFTLEVAAGESWHDFVVWCLARDIKGLENLALIPGTVGAAPIQNIGAYGVEVARFIESVQYIDLASNQLQRIACNDCQFGYRDSIFKGELWQKALIVGVTFSIPKDWQPVVTYGELAALHSPSAHDIFNKVVEVRQAKLPDPRVVGNAGSFFKNPIISAAAFAALQKQWPKVPSYPLETGEIKIPAAWLIDQLGFKGQFEGGIRCHPNQALVLTNAEQGTGEQLLGLARRIKSAVAEQFNVFLEHEVQLIGAKGKVVL